MKDIYKLTCLVVLLLSIAACKENDGYYNFENSESVFSGNALAYYRSKNGVYDSLLLVLDRLPEYKEIVENGDVTLFSPTNASFRLALGGLNIVRANQNRSPLNLQTVNAAELDSMMSKYVVKGQVTTEEMFYVDGLYVETVRYTAENTGDMHAQRIRQTSSGFVDGGLAIVYYSDTKASNFVDQWSRSITQGVNIKTSNSIIHVLANDHEFGFGDFSIRMNK